MYCVRISSNYARVKREILKTELAIIFSVTAPDPGSMIRCHIDPLDPGWGKKSGTGSGMNNPDHISESIETVF
jgi:hypothetical protein